MRLFCFVFSQLPCATPLRLTPSLRVPTLPRVFLPSIANVLIRMDAINERLNQLLFATQLETRIYRFSYIDANISIPIICIAVFLHRPQYVINVNIHLTDKLRFKHKIIGNIRLFSFIASVSPCISEILPPRVCRLLIGKTPPDTLSFPDIFRYSLCLCALQILNIIDLHLCPYIIFLIPVFMCFNSAHRYNFAGIFIPNASGISCKSASSGSTN